jgi:hypothetical protein
MQRITEWAAETATPSDPLQLLLQYGVLGIFAVLLIIYTRGSIAREREKSDQAALQVEKLNDFIRNELLPKQVEATLLHKQVAEVLEEAVQLITEMKIRNSISRQDQGLPPGNGRRGRNSRPDPPEGNEPNGLY